MTPSPSASSASTSSPSTSNPADGRSASRGRQRKRLSARNRQYMVVPANPGAVAQITQMMNDQLNRIGGVEIVRTIATGDAVTPPVAVVRMSDETAALLRRSAGGELAIEEDQLLRAALVGGLSPQSRAAALTTPLGAGFTVTIRTITEDNRPIGRAEVRLVGEQFAAQGITDEDGKAVLTLHGEQPETVMELFVKPRSGHWGLWLHRPEFGLDAVNTVTLKPLSPTDAIDWAAEAMRLDRLPAGYRGAGVKVALIDSGVATTHPQLAKIDHGMDVRSSEGPWTQDVIGHGTPCASVIGAIPVAAHGIHGYAPESELHVCRLTADARCSDLVAALDYCIMAGIDIACFGFGCERGSTIVEQRVIAAKQRGLGIIAGAGNAAGSVQFPACSPHVIAVAAMGQAGTYPDDSPHAFHAATATVNAGRLFVPSFSCRGPELDLCAPGVGVVACQSPDGYAACDGTSLAAANVAALAALVLAHHAEFNGGFANRDARRVERLFQMLKENAQPIGHPWLAGAGLPDASRALGLPSQPRQQKVELNDLLAEMRSAVGRLDVISPGIATETTGFEPPRGPANITPLSLNPFPMTFAVGSGAAPGMHGLKAAMISAGLSGNRYY